MSGPPTPPGPILAVEGLEVRFPTSAGTVRAVRGVSFVVAPGEALGLVGESGCGKTVTALALMDLVPPPGRITAGRVALDGMDLGALDPDERRKVRGRRMAMVFQDPTTSLNPVLPVGRQVTEALRHHLGLGAGEARARAEELLRVVGIPAPGARFDDHPHRFSGGQRQRVMLAMALACRPAVLLADEPTTALDVTIQAQIVALVQELRATLGMALVWITHDLALVAGLVDRVAVMYAGRLVEVAPVEALYATPRHPYTLGLLRSLPGARPGPGVRLQPVAGRPPDPLAEAPGCPFAPRCALAEERCGADVPPLGSVGDGHQSACFRWDEVGL